MVKMRLILRRSIADNTGIFVDHSYKTVMVELPDEFTPDYYVYSVVGGEYLNE